MSLSPAARRELESLDLDDLAAYLAERLPANQAVAGGLVLLRLPASRPEATWRLAGVDWDLHPAFATQSSSIEAVEVEARLQRITPQDA